MPTRRSSVRTARLFRFAVGAGAVCLLAAGCGGEELSKPQYEQQVQAVYEDIKQAFRQAGQFRTLDDLAKRVRQAQEDVRAGADQLDDADAPKAVEEQNEELVQALRGYANDLDEQIEAAEAGDSQRVQSFNRNIVRNRWILQLQEVVEQMTAKGYNLGAIASE